MIDNIVNMIEGIKNKVDTDMLLSNSDPLGYFPEMKNIKVNLNSIKIYFKIYKFKHLIFTLNLY